MPTHPALTPEVSKAIDLYLDQVDSRLPGVIEGFYLVGSIALLDYITGISDIDFVAVSSRPLAESELPVLSEIHHQLVQTQGVPKFDGVYTTWGILSRSSEGSLVHHWLDKTMNRDSRYGANPVTWATMKKHPVVIRGNPTPSIFESDGELREWCKANLQSYWTKWVRSSRTLGPSFLASFTLEAACWGVLGVVRLHATIRTGEIISKTEAFEYGRRVFPREWHETPETALAKRLTRKPTRRNNPIRRRSLSLRFMEYVIADALG